MHRERDSRRMKQLQMLCPPAVDMECLPVYVMGWIRFGRNSGVPLGQAFSPHRRAHCCNSLSPHAPSLDALNVLADHALPASPRKLNHHDALTATSRSVSTCAPLKNEVVPWRCIFPPAPIISNGLIRSIPCGACSQSRPGA